MHNLKTKERAMEAVEILNTLESDFWVGTMLLWDYVDRFNRNKVNYGQMIAIRRMALSYLALNLRKITDFRQKYSIFLNKYHKELFKSVRELIESPGIKKVRDAFVAHASQPLTNNDLANIFREVSKDEQTFLRMIHNPDNPDDQETVHGIIRTIRKDILKDYQITDDEMIQRYEISLDN